jgi:hypothetical protein
VDGRDDLHEFGEFGDGGVDILLLPFEKRDARLAAVDRHLPLHAPPVAQIVQVDHLADLAQAEPDALAAQDPGETRAVAVRIDALRAASLGRDQAFILIEAQRPRGDAELLGQVRDREMVAVVAMFDHRISGRRSHALRLHHVYVNVNWLTRWDTAIFRPASAAFPPPPSTC